MKYKKRYIAVAIIMSLAVIVIIGKRELFNEFFSSIKLAYLDRYIEKNYLYKIDDTKALEGIYNGFLKGTGNRVTYYLNKEDFKQAKIRAEGNYFGTGMSFRWHIDGQSLIITQVIKNSPADREGIKVGDKIVEINGVKAIMANNQQLLEYALSNKEQTTIYKIRKQEREVEVPLIPETVQLKDLESQKLEGKMYIKINTIKEGTSEQLEKLIINQVDQSQGIIIDLRDVYTNNVEEISKIADVFLEEGTAFKMSTKTEEMKAYKMHAGSYKGKLCLLINRGTTGALEALAYTLKERAYLIGEVTAGLYDVSTLVSLKDGSGISVASGKLYDAYGNDLPKEGVEPKERIYLSEKEIIELIENGIISKKSDSSITAGVAYLDKK